MRATAEHKVRRLPVIDGHKLIGVVSRGRRRQGAPERESRRTRRGDIKRLTIVRPRPLASAATS